MKDMTYSRSFTQMAFYKSDMNPSLQPVCNILNDQPYLDFWNTDLMHCTPVLVNKKWAFLGFQHAVYNLLMPFTNSTETHNTLIWLLVRDLYR